MKPVRRPSSRRKAVPHNDLPLEQDTADAETPAHIALGKRIRGLRQQAKLTLAEVAERAGFGKAYLSRIENGQKMPPLATLARIAEVLGVEAAGLLAEHSPVHDWRGVSLVRRNERRPTVLGGTAFGYDYLSVSNATHGRALQPFLFTFPDQIDKYVFFEHDGEELIHILSGRVEWQIGMDKFMLEAGDTLHFDSRMPHRGRSLGGPATALVVMYAPPHGTGELA
ncbi:HTH cro/C1-type domain-containing protein [Bordetella sputigena]|uniref:helix-turn-helix domain-containing protein n=1 Tax=Bordetella sputigena TaxID=1416810 RepID=UPI0039EF0288